MKSLTILSIAQTVLIVFLAYKLFDIESKIEQPSQSSVLHEQTIQQTPAQPVNGSHIDEQQLRHIIREELAVFQTNHTQLATTNKSATIEPTDDYLDPQKTEQLNALLTRFMSDGNLTEQELGEIDKELAGMNFKQRQKVLQQLAKNAKYYSATIVN